MELGAGNEPSRGPAELVDYRPAPLFYRCKPGAQPEVLVSHRSPNHRTFNSSGPRGATVFLKASTMPLDGIIRDAVTAPASTF